VGGKGDRGDGVSGCEMCHRPASIGRRCCSVACANRLRGVIRRSALGPRDCAQCGLAMQAPVGGTAAWWREKSFCSTKCVGMARRRNPVHGCETCSAEIQSGRRYCSWNCYQQSRARPEDTKHCESCNGTIRRASLPVDMANDARWARRRFCSLACSASRDRGTAQLPCLHCGTTSKRTRSRGPGFCSAACHNAHQLHVHDVMGLKMTVHEIAEMCGVAVSVVRHRIRGGHRLLRPGASTTPARCIDYAGPTRAPGPPTPMSATPQSQAPNEAPAARR
jgi:hypothetical protein